MDETVHSRTSSASPGGRRGISRADLVYTSPRVRLDLLVGLFCREAVRALLRHKLRTALTTLGIMIGIAAVVLVVAVGEAGSARAEAELQKLGDNLVWIEAGSRNVNGVRTGSHGTTSLTVEDAEAIRREVPLLKRISPQVDGTVHAIGPDDELDHALSRRDARLPRHQEVGGRRRRARSPTTT